MRQRALLFSAFILLFATASPAASESAGPKEEKKGPKSVVVQGTYPPDRINNDIDEFAKKWQQAHSNPAARAPFFKLVYARNANEFAALRRFSIMLLTVITQKAEELPLNKVYVRAGGNDVPIMKISNWRSDVATGTLAHKVYGPYREDGFYAIPTGMLVRDGQLLIDFAANRNGLVFLQLPSTAAPQNTKNFPNLDPEPNAKPDLKALQALIQLKFPGFPLPKALP